MLENWLELTPYFFGRKMQGVRYVSRLGGGRSIQLSYGGISDFAELFYTGTAGKSSRGIFARAGHRMYGK